MLKPISSYKDDDVADVSKKPRICSSSYATIVAMEQYLTNSSNVEDHIEMTQQQSINVRNIDMVVHENDQGDYDKGNNDNSDDD